MNIAARIALVIDLLKGTPIPCPTCGQPTEKLGDPLITKDQALEILLGDKDNAAPEKTNR